MENLTPSLILLWDVTRSLERGQSVAAGVVAFLEREKKGEFPAQVRLWWRARENPRAGFSKTGLGPARRQLLEVLELGLQGQSILASLKGIEEELVQGCEDEIQNHVARLPLLSLLPLMFLIFPSMMMLLLLPLLKLLQF